MSFIPLGVLAASGAGGGGSFESISTTTLSGTQATVSLGSIPSTYKHLQVRIMARSTRAATLDEMRMRVNNDSGTTYSYHSLSGDGSAVAASGGATKTWIDPVMKVPANATPSIYSGLIIDIHDYASTSKYKTIRVFGGDDQNGEGYIGLISGLWQSTSAITSLDFLMAVNSYATGSTFALYGIKG